MRAAKKLTIGGVVALALSISLGACGKVRQQDPHEAGKARADAKRQQAACASATAYGRLKGLLFDQAIGEHDGDRADLDTLADYSVARMEDPVVDGWDPALDITRCKGRFILQFPAGAERGFAGERRLQADIDYSAQAAADGSGFVYRLSGADAIVAKLAAFNLTSRAYRPPAAIDEREAGPEMPESSETALSDDPASLPSSAPMRAAGQRPVPTDRQLQFAPERSSERAGLEPRKPLLVTQEGGGGEVTIRAFYTALGAGDGTRASAQIIPEKRTSRAFAPAAMSRFYGQLPEPIRLTQIEPLTDGAYQVRYRYSAGRSHCNGSAVVRLAKRGARAFIRSIKALSGC